MDVRRPRSRGPLAIALGVSVSLNIALIAAVLWPDSDQTAVDEAVETTTTKPSPTRELAKSATPGAEAAQEEMPSDAQRVTVTELEGSIPKTMAVAAEPYGDAVSATLSRVLVWDLDLRRDLRPNDRIDAMWRLGASDTVVIEAARYHSQKLGRVVTAYRFQADGDEYPSYWSSEGVEIPYRLRSSPLAEYEQITSLLRDRPNHHGMDFKVDVGTPVLATFDGVVTRANWNWKSNGNCIEIRGNDGVLAKYLHLSKNEVVEGARVRARDVIALSGNTGRSTGPHLHYQLNRGERVLDPIDYHGTDRRTLSDGDRANLGKIVAAADARFESSRSLASN